MRAVDCLLRKLGAVPLDEKAGDVGRRIAHCQHAKAMGGHHVSGITLWIAWCDVSAQLGSGVDLEFAVYAREIRLHRFRADE